MRIEQMEAAKAAMAEWLSHPQELGRIPAKIECVGSFELHEMQYYIFKYRKRLIGQWLLGVCGGYEGDELEHCGHVFSEMKEYSEADAVEKAKAMVETVRSFMMEQAKQAGERGENGGSFVAFALLSDIGWDKEQFVRDLKAEWNLDAAVEEDGKDGNEENEAGNEEDDGDILVFPVDNMTAAVSLMPAPVPNREAEINAENNYMWPEAAEAAKVHKAHIMVAVLGDAAPLEKGRLFVKLLACCCRQKNVTGIYASGTVFEPGYYEGLAGMMKEGELPIFNWIWFGLYRREGGICCYTYGMSSLFGKDEMEVLDADAQPSEVLDFLSGLVAYVLESNVTLNDGETIGFSKHDKHLITRSEGVSLPGMTLKIAY